MCVRVCTVNTSIDVLKATRVAHRKYVFVFPVYSSALSALPLSSDVHDFTCPFFVSSTLRRHAKDAPENN